MSDRVSDTLSDIEAALNSFQRPLVAFSGGKDALVVMHLMNRVRPTPGVCELSFYYERQKQDAIDTARQFGWNVDFRTTFGWDWLRAHPEFIFSDDNKVRAKSFALRHQAVVARAVEEGGYDAAVFGRRTQENTVPRMLYRRKGEDVWQFHPIRSWTHDEVWDYIRNTMKIDPPWIYSTPHAPCGGNSPFYTMYARKAGGVEAAWAIAHSLDPSIHPSRMEAA